MGTWMFVNFWCIWSFWSNSLNDWIESSINMDGTVWSLNKSSGSWGSWNNWWIEGCFLMDSSAWSLSKSSWVLFWIFSIWSISNSLWMNGTVWSLSKSWGDWGSWSSWWIESCFLMDSSAWSLNLSKS